MEDMVAETVALVGRGGGDGSIDCWDDSFTASSTERAPRGGGGRTAALLAKFTRPREWEPCRSGRRPRYGASAAPPRGGGGRVDELDEDLEWTLRTLSASAGVENLV